MGGISQRSTDGVDECEQQQHENGRQRADHGHRRREDGVGLIAVVVGIAKQRGLHAEGEQHEDESRVGIDVGADAIVAGIFWHIASIERHQHIVEEAADDA